MLRILAQTFGKEREKDKENEEVEAREKCKEDDEKDGEDDPGPWGPLCALGPFWAWAHFLPFEPQLLWRGPG